MRLAFRIADARFPIFDSTGAFLHGGRWNSKGNRVIYAGETFAGAMLEVLVHANVSRPPKNHQLVTIHIPDEVQMETIMAADLPGWDAEDGIRARQIGDAWYRVARTAVLRVPSVVTSGREYNLVFNTTHAQFELLRAGAPEPITWDVRLFAR